MPKTLGASQVIKLPTCICNWICSLYLYLWLYPYLYLRPSQYLYVLMLCIFLRLWNIWLLSYMPIGSCFPFGRINSSCFPYAPWRTLPPPWNPFSCLPAPDEFFSVLFGAGHESLMSPKDFMVSLFYSKPVSGINSDRIFLIFSFHRSTLPGRSFNVVAYVAEIVADSFDFYSHFMRKYLSSCGCHLKIQFYLRPRSFKN